jgi:HEAT repeat protein
MMPEVRWKVSLLFAIITISVFFSIYMSSDSFIEASGNQTHARMGANASNTSASSKTLISDLINTLETGNNETKLDAASKLGNRGKPAANALIEKIETDNSSSERTNSYMLLALLETGDERAETVLSEDFGKKAALNNTTTASTSETLTEKGLSEEILQALQAKDKDMKKRLANSIDRDYGNKTDALEKALISEEQNSSIYIPIAFSEFGPQEPGDETEKLLKAIKSENGPVRVAAMMALGENKERAAVEPLNNIVLRDYPLAKSSAIISLGEIGDKGALATVQKQMQSDSDFTRSCATIALGKIGDESTLPYLIAKLKDSSPGIRSNAALALARIGNETAVEPLIRVLESGKISQGKAQDNTNTNTDIRKSVVLALGEIGGSRATEALINVTTDKEEKNDVRMTAASALGEIRDPRIVEIFKTLIDDKTIDNGIKKKALIALGKTKNQEGTEILLGKIGDKEFGTTARESLMYMGETAVDPLIGNLKTTDEKVKNETALILIEIGDPRAINPLILAYQ